MRESARRGTDSGGPAIAVIGAGLAGLAAARRLSEAGRRVLVFDKGRGHGGRCATRRREAGTFNHGASALFPRVAGDSEGDLGRLCERPELRSLLTPWRPRIGRLGSPHPARGLPADVEEVRVVRPGMSALAKALAGDVERRFSERVRAVEEADGLRLRFESGAVAGPFESVIVTAPPPQAAELLRDVPELRAPLRTVAMSPAFSLLVTFPEPVTELDWIEGTAESAVFRAVRQPKTGPGEAFVVQSGDGWSREHFERRREDLVPRMLALFRDALAELEGRGSELPEPSFAEVHRWAYAFPAAVDRRKVLASDDGRCLYASGALNGGDLAGAREAGLAAAAALLARLD